MNTSISEQPVLISPSTPWVSWGAVIAGVVIATAVQIGLTELCISLGLSVFEPNDPQGNGSTVLAGSIIALLVAGLISIFVGSWVAGRMKRHGTPVEAAVHGGLVWAVAGIFSLLLATMSVGVLASGALSLVGSGLTAAASGADTVARTAGAVAPSVAGIAAPSWDAVKQTVQGSFGGANRQGGSDAGAPTGSVAEGATADAASASQAEGATANTGSDTRYRDQSRLMELLGQYFTTDANAALPAAEQQELTAALAAQLGISAQAAQQTLAQWQKVWRDGVSRYEAAKEEAKRMAVEAAATAQKRTAQAAMVAFVMMLVGLVASVIGAMVGSACVWTKARDEAGRIGLGATTRPVQSA